jgi:hypothetical protein
VTPVKEGETALALRIDDQMRPKQLIEMEKVGLPFKPGEGPRYASRSDVPLDPSAVLMSTMGTKATKSSFFGDTFARRQTSGIVAGLGQLEPLAALALGPIQSAMNSIKSREAALQAEAPEVLAAITGPYSVLRADIDRYYSEMVADPAKVTTSGIPFAAAAATYKNVLDTAIGKLNDAKAKAKAKAKKAAAPAITPYIAPAVVQTVKSPYGMIVLGVGAAVIVALLVVRAMQKKGD